MARRKPPRIPAGTTGKVGTYGWVINGKLVTMQPVDDRATGVLERRRVREAERRVTRPRLPGDRVA
jgi:hypothetical protein